MKHYLAEPMVLVVLALVLFIIFVLLVGVFDIQCSAERPSWNAQKQVCEDAP